MPNAYVRGPIIPTSHKFYYDYWKEPATCPRDIEEALAETKDGETLDVFINSPGGIIDVGAEIYTMLRAATSRINLQMHITGQACSAASVIAMAGPCEMSPTALMMVHCVSTWAGGNHNTMEHAAEMLRTADEALCTAYTEKTGMSKEEALQMMEKETWLTAQMAKDYGLVDAIMFENQTGVMTAAVEFALPTEEQLNQVRNLMEGKKPANNREMMEARLKYLRLACR